MDKIEAIRKDFGFRIQVRKMGKDEMPENVVVYYCDDESGNIYSEKELELLSN